MLPKCNSRVKTEVEGGVRFLTIAGNRYAGLPTSSSPAQYPTCRLTPIDSEFPQWETASAGRESVRPLASPIYPAAQHSYAAHGYEQLLSRSRVLPEAFG